MISIKSPALWLSFLIKWQVAVSNFPSLGLPLSAKQGKGGEVGGELVAVWLLLGVRAGKEAGRSFAGVSQRCLFQPLHEQPPRVQRTNAKGLERVQVKYMG